MLFRLLVDVSAGVRLIGKKSIVGLKIINKNWLMFQQYQQRCSVSSVKGKVYHSKYFLLVLILKMTGKTLVYIRTGKMELLRCPLTQLLK
ncbi:hypothetical protein PSMA108079_00035 [Pseudoalteromonas mariniglutinosa]